jgi:hypothetical protein
MRERKRPGAFGAGSHTTTRLADRQPESAWSLGKVARPNKSSFCLTGSPGTLPTVFSWMGYQLCVFTVCFIRKLLK